MPPRGFEHTVVPDLVDASMILLAVLYHPATYIPVPPPFNAPKHDRNDEICTRYLEGWSIRRLSREYGVSKARVYQILKAVGVARSRWANYGAYHVQEVQ